ncbi:zinc ABC transporter substrate-binding protein [Candidatus Saccharibacteria bacterium]|nr:zinc ABC transporter substrate-binding protein [Candidatus Saccharibacteria bacterium]
MKRSYKNIVLVLVVFVILITGIVALVINLKSRENKHYTVVTSNFASYDFARAVTGDAAEVKMLLKPGAEAHDFEPTPEDIIDIKNADLFVYIGGESEEWIEKILESNNISPNKTLELMDEVELIEEEDSYSTEEAEYDEHIWTSPKNAIMIVQRITDKLAEINPQKVDEYTNNANKYVERLSKIDEKFQEIVSNASKNELIFGDRFPFLYFVREYGLKYTAAFPGCSEQTEADAATIARLIDRAKATNTKVILKIELTSDKIAKTIAETVGATVMEFSAAHNVSKADFEKGVTYADLMEQNTKVLEEALR